MDHVEDRIGDLVYTMYEILRSSSTDKPFCHIRRTLFFLRATRIVMARMASATAHRSGVS